MNVVRRNWHSINCLGNGLTVMQVVYRINGLKFLLKLLMKVPKAAMSDWLILNLPLSRKQNKLR